MTLAPYLMSTAAVAAVGFAAQALTYLAPLPHVSVLFLAAVVASAALWGLGPSLLAALLSVAASSYFFYRPIHSFHVADPQEIADLVIFVLVAVLTSRLAAGVRAQALEARRQQVIVADLHAFGERLASCANDAELEAAVVERFAPLLGRPVHLLAAGADWTSVPAEVAAPARQVISGGEAAIAGWRLERLATAQGTIAVLASRESATPVDREHLRALLAQAGTALERARLRREIADARIRMQGDALREALLNSVSHDLQTPLAAILGSATALESFGEHGEAKARRELVATIRDEAERLGNYIGNVLDLTRIRAGQIAPRMELVELADIVNAALHRKRKALAQQVLRVELPADLPMLRLDLFLIEHALANVLDNAARYAPAGSTVSVVARAQDGEVVVEVCDEGEGMAAGEAERIFEAFYRGVGGAGAQASGTGLGLAISRAFVEANGGSIDASSAGPGRGTTVRLHLPVPARVPAGALPAQ